LHHKNMLKAIFLKEINCILKTSLIYFNAKYFSASRAAIQPVPAAVIA